MDLQKILNALFTSLNSHVDRGAALVAKAVKEGGQKDLGKAITEQTKALRILFTEFSLGLKKMENPEFSVVVQMEPIQERMDSLLELMKKQKELSLTPLYNELHAMRLIMQENKPEKLGEKFDALDAVFKGINERDKQPAVFSDSQIGALLAAITNIGGGGGFATNGGVKSATRYLIDTVTLTLADEEYEYTFPANTVSWTMKQRVPGNGLFYASSTGKLPVSGNNSDYMTLLPMGARSQDNVEWGGVSMFLESDGAGDVIEFEIFQL